MHRLNNGLQCKMHRTLGSKNKRILTHWFNKEIPASRDPAQSRAKHSLAHMEVAEKGFPIELSTIVFCFLNVVFIAVRASAWSYFWSLDLLIILILTIQVSQHWQSASMPLTQPLSHPSCSSGPATLRWQMVNGWIDQWMDEWIWWWYIWWLLGPFQFNYLQNNQNITNSVEFAKTSRFEYLPFFSDESP